MKERIELRAGGKLLGILLDGGIVQFKKGRRVFEVDFTQTVASGKPVIFERVLLPEGSTTAPASEASEAADTDHA